MTPHRWTTDRIRCAIGLCALLATALTGPAQSADNSSSETTVAAVGQTKLATVRLYYHDASAVADRLNSVFDAGELKASGLGRDLILRASSDAVLQDAKALVQELDSKPAQFQISIRQVAQRSGITREIGAGIDARVPPRGDDQSRISLRYGSNQYSTGDRSQQTVTVLEGASVSLTAGQLRPVQNVFIARDGLAIGTVAERELVGSDLLVTPTLAGSIDEPLARVAIAVRNQRDATSSESLEAFELVSTQLIPMGEWSPLGGTERQDSGQSQANYGTSYSTRASEAAQNYEILIRLVP